MRKSTSIAALTAADVTVRDVRLAVDLAGKAYFTLTGTLDAIEPGSYTLTLEGTVGGAPAWQSSTCGP